MQQRFNLRPATKYKRWSTDREAADRLGHLISIAHPFICELADDLAFAGVLHGADLHNVRGRAIVDPSTAATISTPTTSETTTATASASTCPVRTLGFNCSRVFKDFQQVSRRVWMQGSVKLPNKQTDAGLMAPLPPKPPPRPRPPNDMEQLRHPSASSVLIDVQLLIRRSAAAFDFQHTN